MLVVTTKHSLLHYWHWDTISASHIDFDEQDVQDVLRMVESLNLNEEEETV